jgi:hypothetical protein
MKVIFVPGTVLMFQDILPERVLIPAMIKYCIQHNPDTQAVSIGNQLFYLCYVPEMRVNREIILNIVLMV